MNKLAILILLSAFCISCSSVEQENAEVQSKEKAQQHKKDTEQNKSKVEVTSSQAKQTKPLSHSAGNAEQQKNKETYVVPNKEFPLKENAKPKDKVKDKEPPKI